MISLTYFSTAVRAFDTDQLEDLLADSRSRNLAAGLTGRLLYAGGHFVQTLEGQAESVDTTYARIERDPRHRDVFVTLREKITARAFPEWAMGFETLDTQRARQIPGFDDYLSQTGEHGGPGRAGVFHRIFRDNMR